jgi:hypothetical protein
MKYRQEGVSQDHARPSVSHHGANRLPLLWSIAMDRAVGADWFFRTEGTLVQAGHGVVQQFPASPTEFLRFLMMVTTIDPNHGLDRFALSRA